MKKNIPNLITLLNLVAGFTALVYITKGEAVTAAWLIVIAMVFDFGDGLAARLLHAYSDLGKQLDSLADLVSFGVVPGMIVYFLLTGLQNEYLRILPAVIFPLFGAIRLARFNIDPDQKEVFTGLPVPAASLAIVGLVLSSHYGESVVARYIIESPALLISYSTGISLLMVAPVKMMSLKFSSLKLASNISRYVLILVSVILLALPGFAGVIFIIPLYIAISLFSVFFG